MADGNEVQGPEVIWVKGTAPVARDGGAPVALCEYDPAHPSDDHWVFVSGPTPVQVARTALVQDRLRAGILAEVSAAPPKASARKAGGDPAASGTTDGGTTTSAAQG